MKAAVLFGKEDLRIVDDFREPETAENEVLIQPKYAGLCSTDRSLYRGYVPFTPPLIIGHEIAGIVKEVGKAVTGMRKGDHVIVPPVYPGCGENGCPSCKEGLTNRCKRSVFIGHGVNGGAAELMTAPANYVFKVDEKVPLDEVCIVPDAVSTPFHALKSRSVPAHIFRERDARELVANETHWLRGKNVVVFGVGGVGGPAIDLASGYFGAKNVVVVDIFDDKLEYARKLGATHIVNSRTFFENNDIDIKKVEGRERAKAVTALARHVSSRLKEDRYQVDLVVDCSGVADTFPVGVEVLTKNRTLIQVGWPARPARDFLNRKIMDKYLTINGTWACPMEEMAECVRAVEEGRIDLHSMVTNKEFDLDGLEDAIHALEAGKILGRASIEI